jgi:hypothetical protein
MELRRTDRKRTGLLVAPHTLQSQRQDPECSGAVGRLLKYSLAALLKEREVDLAFFDHRIEKGLVTKLEGIVGSEFVHMD